MAEKKDPIRSLIDTGRRAGKLTSSEISDAMEENGNVLDVEAMEKLYEELESNGIEIVDDTPVDVSSALPSSEEGADDYEVGVHLQRGRRQRVCHRARVRSGGVYYPPPHPRQERSDARYGVHGFRAATAPETGSRRSNA